MNSVGKKRLLKLADFLETLPKKKFDLNVYVGDIKDGQAPNKQYDCGTTACAIGWCPVVFSRSGVHYQEQYDYGGRLIDMDVVFPTNDGDLQNDMGAEKFFDLTEGELNYLFMPNSYMVGRRGPKSVANRIRQVVETGKVPKKFVCDDEDNNDYCFW